MLFKVSAGANERGHFYALKLIVITFTKKEQPKIYKNNNKG